MNKIIITKDNFSELKKDNTYFIISEDIDFRNEKLTLGYMSILSFIGGTFSNGNIKFNYTLIEAAPYNIFKNMVFDGKIRNSYISAEWFGDIINNAAQCINTALKYSGTSTVTAENMTYTLSEPVILNRNGQKIDIAGQLILVNDIPGIVLKASNLSVRFNSITSNYNSSNNTEYVGTGIKFSGNVYNSNISFVNIYNTRKGIDFTPTFEDNETINYSGTQYNKIEWQLIRSFYCIYINLWNGLIDKTERRTWCNENQFFGGRVCGAYGIYIDDSQSNPTMKYADLINGNIFRCIGFEDISECNIRLRHSVFDRFYDLRMNESQPQDDKPYVDIDTSENIDITTKTYLPYNKIKYGNNCNNINIWAFFTDNNIDTRQSFDKMTIIANSLANKNNSGTCISFVTSTNQARPFIKNIVHNVLNPAPKYPLTFNDLFQQTNLGQLILSNKCSITLTDNNILFIDFNNSIFRNAPEMFIYLQCSIGSKLVFLKDKKEVTTITQSGVYTLAYNSELNIISIKSINL